MEKMKIFNMLLALVYLVLFIIAGVSADYQHGLVIVSISSLILFIMLVFLSFGGDSRE